MKLDLIEAESAKATIDETVEPLENELTQKYGVGQRERAARGLRQVASLWLEEDGDATQFAEFARTHFAGDQAALDTLFMRFETLLEQLDGHMHEIGRHFRQQLDLDLGPLLPVDELFGGYNASAHVTDDMFANKLAFVVLLNFPLTTLDERLREGRHWTRRQWAETRLAQRFDRRIPAEAIQAITEVYAKVGHYISEYNIWMHHLVNDQGERLFPSGLRLISHWGLRDEIKSDYVDAARGLEKQRMILKVMERVITQTIPSAVIDNPRVDWNPFSNEVTPTTVHDYDEAAVPARSTNAMPEPDTRYAMLLETFHAARKIDPYSPTAPTHIARRFEEDREIPEARVKAMLEQVCTSQLLPEISKLIVERLGRPLEPFDIWYNGFRPRTQFTEPELDEKVRALYPTPESYQKAVPGLLEKLGFSAQRAKYLAEKIVIDPGRGAGHAMGAEMRSEKAHLRTRIEASGMNYQGFNVAAHEIGHNVEQVLSLNDVDYTLLRGVPNTAFTEAFAFLFQSRDLELLGLPAPDDSSRAEKTLGNFWSTYEIAGVSLVDMAVWHWMYDNPDATAAQLKEAVLQIAKDHWNRFYAPIFGERDVIILAVYSHMIESFLYLPDYPIGHLICHQIDNQMRKAGSIGAEFERMATQGRIAPDLWMQTATGSDVGADAMIQSATEALAQVKAAARS